MEFVIYSKPACPYCDQAKALLSAQGRSYREIMVDVGQEKRQGAEYITIAQLKQLVPGARTVPQIFKNGIHLGGYDDLQRHIMSAGGQL